MTSLIFGEIPWTYIKNKKNILTLLDGDGDFRSNECIKLLKQSDVVITNPPFSLFREYVALLIEYDKKFVIIGNDNCRTYKEIFPLIKNNQIWCGYNHVKEFCKSDGTIQKFGNVSWYTNLPITKRNEELILYKRYYMTEADKNNPNYTNPDYPKYDNYDAINVDKVSDIPVDYDGVMGVPITFLDKYTPKQFDIIKFRKGDDNRDLEYTKNGGNLERERELAEQKSSRTSEYSFVIIGIANSARFIGDFKCYTKINGRKIYNRLLIKRI